MTSSQVARTTTRPEPSGDRNAEVEPPLPEVSNATDVRSSFVGAVVWVSAWVAVGYPDALGFVAAALGTIALVAFGLMRKATPARAHLAVDGTGVRRRRARLVVIASLVGVIPVIVVALAAGQRMSPELAERAESGGASEWQVQITGPGKPVRGGASHTSPQLRYSANIEPEGIPVVLLAPAPATAIAIGSSVTVRATARLTEPGERAVAVLFSNAPPQLRAPPHPLLQAAHDVRARLAAASQGLPSPGNMLVPGLAAGDEQLVSDALDADMKMASLTHLTAVSGSNIAIVVGLVLWFGRCVGVARAWRLALSLPILALFVLLVTPQGSVIRAAAMAVVVLGVALSGRPVHGMPVLGVAVSVCLVADPWLSRDYGFALSVAATAGLLAATGPVSRFLQRWLPRPIAVLLAVPTVAQAACQPILLLLEPSLPTYGVLANLLATPAAPIATVAGLAAVAATSIAPALAEPLLWLAWVPAQWIGLVAETFAEFPVPQLPWVGGPIGAVLWLLMTAVVVVAVRPTATPVQRRLQRLAAAVLVAVVMAVGTVWSGERARQVRDFPEDWRLIACDVGQGDAVLVRAHTVTMLIDTGIDPETIASCLREFDIDHVDVLVLTHFDADHAGAAASLPVPVTAVWVPDTLEAQHEPTVRRFQTNGVDVSFVAAGDTVVIGDSVVRVLWPPRSPSGPSTLTDNAGSIVLRIDPTEHCHNSCLRVIALGDSGESVQQELKDEDLPADIVKVAHHGSRDQNADTYAAIGAQVALISVGAENRYGHPTTSALAMLQRAGTAWFRTDQHGHIAIGSADAQQPQLITWTQRHPGEGNSEILAIWLRNSYQFALR